MSDNIIVKSFVDSFDILKTKWSSKRDAISLCISEMTKYDCDIAFDMWLYILKNNSDLLNKERDSEYLVSDLIEKMVETLMSRYDADENEIFIKDIIPRMQNRQEILSQIFGNTYCAGARRSSFNDYMPKCLAYMLLVANPDVIINIMKLMSSNKYMKDITIGTFVMRSIAELKSIMEDNDISNKYSVTSDIKMALLNSLDLVRNSTEKAECNIAVLSIV